MRVPTDCSHNHPTQKCALGGERGEFPSLSLAWRRVARKIDRDDQVEYDHVYEQDHSEVRISRFSWFSLDLELQTSERRTTGTDSHTEPYIYAYSNLDAHTNADAIAIDDDRER
jgi:hypothetical protein